MFCFTKTLFCLYSMYHFFLNIWNLGPGDCAGLLVLNTFIERLVEFKFLASDSFMYESLLFDIVSCVAFFRLK